MHRFICRPQDIASDSITLFDNEQVHHIKDVLRLKSGEKVIVFEPGGNEYLCKITEVDNTVILTILNKIAKKEDKVKLAVGCAIPKNAKMDEIIDKLVQLGVEKVIPLKTKRVVVKLNKQKESLRLVRWRKIALSAAKQSQRNRLAVIEPVMSLEEALKLAKDYDLKVIAHLTGERKTLASIIAANSNAQSIIALIGPEGDFSPEEVVLAVEAGFTPVTLGDSVLRVDTAAIAVASFINLYAGS